MKARLISVIYMDKGYLFSKLNRPTVAFLSIIIGRPVRIYIRNYILDRNPTLRWQMTEIAQDPAEIDPAVVGLSDTSKYPFDIATAA